MDLEDVQSESNGLSEVFTDQKRENTCAYHSAAKVIVQNVFQFFYPSKIDADTYERNQFNQFVDFDIYNTGIDRLTPEL